MQLQSMRPVVLLLGLLVGCTSTHEVKAPYKDAGATPVPPLPDGGDDADGGEADAASDAMADAGAKAAQEGPTQEEICAQEVEDSLDGLPDDLICLGLYTDLRTKTLADGVRFFEPAYPLWSDGAGKVRWIKLPEGTQIDASDPDNWIFPVGTKTFKEFRVNNRRIETRVYQKVREDRWVRSAYEWNRNEDAATRSYGITREDILLQGTEYRVPSGRECDQCHGGHVDKVLGFEAVSLGLEGAEGLTLSELVSEGLLDPPPLKTELRIGDDGTEHAAAAMGFMHVNCGVCCHNANQNSEAYSTGLRLKLPVAELDGRSSEAFETRTTSMGVDVLSNRWGDERVRIEPGNSADSILFQLVTTRIGEVKEQMPPIATKVVPTQGVVDLAAWIDAMPPTNTNDGE